MAQSDTWKGSGTVLVVDDEETVRALAQMTLKRSGFDVVTAVDGRNGLELYDQHRGEIVAVLLDMTMPELGGEATLAEIRKRSADLPVILSSGFSKMDPDESVLEQDHVRFLQKPYLPKKLLQLLRAFLESS